MDINMLLKKYLLVIVLLLAVVLLGAWAVGNYRENKDLSYAVSTKYQSDFEEFYEEMTQLSSSLEKCTLSNDEDYVINSLSEAAESAASAKEMLSKLPVSQINAGKIQSVLSVGEDYARASMRSFAENDTITTQERNAILAISTAVDSFTDSLDKFYSKLQTGKSYEWIKKNADYYFSEADDEFGEVLEEMSEALSDFPDINYDGKYSSHLENIAYKGISGDEVHKDDIKDNLSKNIGEGWNVEYFGEGKGSLPTHSYTATNGDNTMNVTYSKQGGSLISAISHNAPKEAKISVDEAEDAAEEFLEGLGMDNMDAEYYDYYDNTLSVTFAYSHNDIKCLGDTVTVQVSMEDGKVIGYEANEYYKSHYERDNSTAKITATEAIDKVSDNLSVEEVNLCYLPTEGGNENLCYEILGSRNNEKYLVYIDANTGMQRDMVKVTVGENIFKVD